MLAIAAMVLVVISFPGLRSPFPIAPSGLPAPPSGRTPVAHKDGEACCVPRAGTRCVMTTSDTSRALRRGGKLRIGFVTYATGPYGAFVEDLWASLRARAFVGHEVHLFFFTDRAGDPDFLADPRVHKRQQARLGWPFDSLGRHFLYLAAADWFEGMDYLISVDADSVLQGSLSDSVLGERIATIQAWSFGHPKREWTLERRKTVMNVPYSAGFVTDEEAICYFTGNLFGGSRKGFLQLLQEIVDLARADLSDQPRRVALWHDESYLNTAFFRHPPSTIWGPNFMYPEPPADDWLYSENNNAHRFWQQTAKEPVRFPPADRAFLNLGVRKHTAKKLNEFQPLSGILPAEMSETGAPELFPLPPPQNQVRDLVVFLVLAPSVPLANAPLAVAMSKWCVGVRCKFLLANDLVSAAPFLPEFESNLQSGNEGQFGIHIPNELALVFHESPLTQPDIVKALANMMYVLESASEVHAVWGCIREQPDVSRRTLLSDSVCSGEKGAIVFDSIEAACWQSPSKGLPMMVRLESRKHLDRAQNVECLLS